MATRTGLGTDDRTVLEKVQATRANRMRAAAREGNSVTGRQRVLLVRDGFVYTGNDDADIHGGGSVLAIDGAITAVGDTHAVDEAAAAPNSACSPNGFLRSTVHGSTTTSGAYSSTRA